MDSEVTELLYLWSIWHLLFNKALQQLIILYLYTTHHCTLRQLTVFQGEIVRQLCNIALQHTDTSVCGGKDHLYNSYHITSKTWVVWLKSLVLRIKMISISLPHTLISSPNLVSISQTENNNKLFYGAFNLAASRCEFDYFMQKKNIILTHCFATKQNSFLQNATYSFIYILLVILCNLQGIQKCNLMISKYHR